MNKYRVWLTVRGAVFRPTYDGYVDVYADTPEDAKAAAIRRLKNTSFPDVWNDDFRVDRVEIR